jgi:hypothetical protein
VVAVDGPNSNETPTLVVLSSGADLGRRIVLERAEIVVGRAPSSDLRFDDPGVSRTHAVLRRRGAAVYLEDTGSTSGTFVNRNRVTAPRQLHPGDVIALAGVVLRFEGQSRAADVTHVGGLPPVPSDGRRTGEVRYDVGHQQAEMINNIGRDQFLIQQRENFLREVAGTRTKARYLILLGFILIVVGFSMFAGGVLSFLNQIPQYDGFDTSSEMPTPFGNDVFGVPSGLLGWALAAAGMFVLVVGVVMHVVATSRRKRVDQNYPDPRSMWRER